MELHSRTDIVKILMALDKNKAVTGAGFHYAGCFFSYWMLVRRPLYNLIAGQLGYRLPSASSKPPSLIEKAKLIFNFWRARIRRHKSVDVMFISSNIGNLPRSKSRVENIYHDQMALEIQKQNFRTIILELPCIKMFNKRYFQLNSYSLNWTCLKLKLVKKKQQSWRDLSCESRFVQDLYKALQVFLEGNVPLQKTALANFFNKELSCFYRYTSLWDKVLSVYSPRAIITQDISYGGLTSVLSVMARARGVMVIEDQHGIISLDHSAYNYGEGFVPNWLSDYFWLYGPSWKKDIHYPGKTAIIGNAYFASQVDKILSENVRKYDIFVISDCLRPENTAEVLLTLSQHEWHVLFRPHPREINELNQRYPNINAYENVSVSRVRDIYPEIACSRIVIMLGNYISTVAFEARAMGYKVILLYDNNQKIEGAELIDDGFVMLDSMKDLIRFLRSSGANCSGDDKQGQGFYRLDWRENLRKFIDETDLKSG